MAACRGFFYVICIFTYLVACLVAGTCIRNPGSRIYSFRRLNTNFQSRVRQFLLNEASAERIEEFLRETSRKPHLAGSDQNNLLADQLIEKWKSYGFETKRDTYDVLLSYPGDESNRNKAEIVDSDGSLIYMSQTEERILDPDQEGADVIPPFNSYAKAGTVSSRRVYYVNYCQDEDFKLIINDTGVDFTDSIVICRYGQIFRGNKVSLAQSYGAIGAILYNDPEDYVDLSTTNATYEGTYPNTGYLPPSGAQRGTLLIGKGDPLTKDLPALDYVHRITPEKARSEKIIPDIPTQPLGYEDATQFLSQLSQIPDSSDVPEAWKGGIDSIVYKIGGELPNNRTFRITNNNREERRNITNVFGIIKGTEEPDRYVLIGNHRDAWMFGATDPLSGTAAMMETARMFSKLIRTYGWKPRRTIIFCSWDAEEYGLIGSIEWLQDLQVIMKERAVAYLNCDMAVMYPELFGMASSPLIYEAVMEATKFVPYANDTSKSIYDNWLARLPDPRFGFTKPFIFDLGSGSDHSGFIHKLGIASINFAYLIDRTRANINDFYPLYHTTYETFRNMKEFVDPTFQFHKSISQVMAELLRDLSDSLVLPFKTADYATRLQQILVDLSTRLRSRLALQGLDKSLDDLKQAVDRFGNATELFDQRARAIKAAGSRSRWNDVRRINDQLFLLERAFINDVGILDRDDKHVVFAPALTNAYGSAAFPGIGDSLFLIKGDDDEEGWARVRDELGKAIYGVESATKFLADLEKEFW